MQDIIYDIKNENVMIFRVDLLYLAATVQQNDSLFWSGMQAYTKFSHKI